MSQTRLLMSLEMAALGDSGMPQDSRLLFKALSQSPAIELSGLLTESQGERTRHARPGSPPSSHAREILDASNYFLALSGIEPVRHRNRFQRWLERFEAIRRTYLSGQSTYRLRLTPPGLFEGVAWRQLFQRSLSSQDQTGIARRPLYYTNLTLPDQVRSALLPWAPSLKLDTSGFDAVIFPDARPVRVSPGTRKFVRYHDAIPILEPDLLGDGAYTAIHYAFLCASRRDSHFVCNSDATRLALCSIFPDLEPRSTVIPCAIDPGVSEAARTLPVAQIVRTRLSVAALGGERTPGQLAGILGRARLEKPWRYVLAVSAIEPKKNVPAIVRAWERLRAQHNERLRLVIVGKSSWGVGPSFTAMRPHVASGDLLHLEDLPFVELQALMLGAEALIFPSLAEGFGYPPVEALVTGLAPVVSDLPALRDTLGDGAIYVDPYDVQSVAAGLSELIFDEGRERRRNQIVEAGRRRIAEYSLENTAERWRGLLERAVS